MPFNPAGLDASPLTPLGKFDASRLRVKFPTHSYYTDNPEVNAAIQCILNDEDISGGVQACPNTVRQAKELDTFQFITR